jgi:hypothetical protein
MDRWEQAADAACRVIDLAPEPRRAYEKLIRWIFTRPESMPESIETTLTQALQKVPRHAMAHVARGVWYHGTKRCPLAQEDFEAALGIAKEQESKKDIHVVESWLKLCREERGMEEF